MSTTTVARPNPEPLPQAHWYRHRWPWILMAGPAFVVGGGSYAMWLAASTDDGLVADDYYKRGLAINQMLDREDRGSALGLRAVVDVDDRGEATIELSGRDASFVGPPSVRLRLVHPTRAGHDVGAELKRDADGLYVGHLGRVVPGRWLVIVESDAWRLPALPVSGPLANIRLETTASADPTPR
jgi:uncharacterized protein